MTPLDSAIFAPLFTDEEVSTLFSDGALVHALVEVEIALGRAEAPFGIIPPKAAERIAEARAEKINIEALTKGTLHSGFPIIALVEELRKQVGSEAAPFVHWGATTQDTWTPPVSCSFDQPPSCSKPGLPRSCEI